MRALLVIMLFIVPVAGALGFMLADGLQPAGWAALLVHPQLLGGMALSLFTGLASTMIAVFISFLIAAARFEQGKPARGLGAMLAVPHLAFAIGLSFLAMPSGPLARLIAPAFSWTSPPQWVSVHDPYGLALIVALACKETAFLLFALLGILAREDMRQSFKAQKEAALALGHGGLSIWLRLFMPQLWPQTFWPIVIVFVYASSVVDMALVLGPTQPPTFAVVAWTDLNSATPADNDRGAAGAMLLALAAAAAIGVVLSAARITRPAFKRWSAKGPSRRAFPIWLGSAKWFGLRLIFVAAAIVLIALSFAPLWPFPSLLPPEWSAAAWAQVVARPQALFNSLIFSGSAALAGLIIVLCWLESRPESHDRYLMALCLLVLGLPSLLIGLGEYRFFLRFDLVANGRGVFLAHLIPATAYIFIMLRGPYRAYDPRWRDAASGLLATPWRFVLAVKWPMLKAPILASLAVGFAVAIAQYVPVQLVSAGRFTTLTLEAVTLTSGSNRSLAAAFALLLMAPPLVGFGLASLLGRPRWRAA